MSAFLDIDRTYREYGHLVLRRAKQILQNDSEAREVLQEVFLSLLERPEQYGGKSAITTWLYSATTHLCYNKLRAFKTRRRLLGRVFSAKKNELASEVEATIGAQDILKRLPRKLALVAIYYYLDEMSHQEISEVMNCSRRQVGNLIEKMHCKVQKLEKMS